MTLTAPLLLLIFTHLRRSAGVELTFELAESSRECFYEEAALGSRITFEFQVVDGGSYDVDVVVQDPAGKTIFEQQRSQYETTALAAADNGTYTFCFDNQFSTFSHKLVYMNLEVDPSPGSPEHQEHAAPTAMTQMESSVQEIQEALRSVTDHQTHHRLREAQSRRRAEDLRDRVFWWSLAETAAILFVSISQVYIVKMFFAFRDPAPFTRA